MSKIVLTEEEAEILLFLLQYAESYVLGLGVPFGSEEETLVEKIKKQILEEYRFLLKEEGLEKLNRGEEK